MSEYAVTVLGADRPGIIADVSAILARLGLNLTDSSMTRLRGHFAMTLICAGPPPPAEVEAALGALSDLVVGVREVAPDDLGGSSGAPYVLTVHGADKLGIVAAVTRVLAGAGANITDLTTRLTGQLYLLVAEVDVPADAELLHERVRAAAAELGVEASLRPAEADVL